MKPAHLPGIVLMNALCYPFTALWTLLGSILFWFPVGPLTMALTRWPAGKVTRLYVWVYGRVWLWFFYPFVRFEREGFEHGDLKTPSVMVVNHLSFFDTFFMGGLPFFDVTFAVRSWPFKMLWFRPVMNLSGYLDVESLPFEETLKRSRKILDAGGHVLFFPEGHRSRDGRLGRFYSGGFKLAIEAGVPVVPLCITGTGGMLPPGRWWLRPSKVKLKALPSVDSSKYKGELGHRQMAADVREMIAKHVEPGGRAAGSR